MAKLGLYDPDVEFSACGVGFITRKDGMQHHDVIERGNQALCAIPHRGGMSAEGVGDGAGVSIDLSAEFFSAITGELLEPGRFGVANLFMPSDHDAWGAARELVRGALAAEGLEVLLERDVPVDTSAVPATSLPLQLPIVQWVFRADLERSGLDRAANAALLEIEKVAFIDSELAGLYPLSLSARTQVLKGRLNAGEVISYFTDLRDPRHSVRTLYFHTRFSTNTEPRPMMAQPFRLMAHNGELNTDRKNRMTDDALARARERDIVRPHGQSDSSRLDQTLQSRVFDDDLDIIEAVVSLMPPAWEKDTSLPENVRDMLEYWSLYEEKNDGPAAVIFSDGDVVGARLDRLGLRPLRTVETDEYLVVSSEAGQVPFDETQVTHRGRIGAGSMLVLDHRTGRIQDTREVLEMLASRRDYGTLLQAARVQLDDIDLTGIERGTSTLGYDGDLSHHGRYVSYNLNQETFRFMLDPMLADGTEKIGAMGYGNAINALSDHEGGMAKYFSQRFAQVTNPPLDSIREADGMTMRVALGAKPDGGAQRMRQIVIESPILNHRDMVRLRHQQVTPLQRFDMLYTPEPEDSAANARSVLEALDALCDEVESFARREGGIAVLSDRSISREKAPLALLLALAAVDQRLIATGLRQQVSIIAESGQLPSSHHVASALGFGASAVYSLSARLRAEEKYPSGTVPATEVTDTDLAFARFRKAAEKSLAKTMGRVGLCTVESYIGGAFFEPNYLDTHDPVLSRCFPHLDAPVGGVGFERIARSGTDWHMRAASVETEQQVPLLGLFKERSDGAGHSYGVSAVRGFEDMTEERASFAPEGAASGPGIGRLTLHQLDDAYGASDEAYLKTGFEALSPEAIDGFEATRGYRQFLDSTRLERARRPAALRDVLALPADVTGLTTPEEFARELGRFSLGGNSDVRVRGLVGERDGDLVTLRLTHPETATRERHDAIGRALHLLFPQDVTVQEATSDAVVLRAGGEAARLLDLLREAPDAIDLEEVEPAHEITRHLASGAMSHGALVASAHEAVAHGTNMVGGYSNSGEGGEHHSRYGTIRGSRIKQFASGRFGIWTGYLADPMLEEIEIKIGQGAKPGEGGQLPAPKVNVEIAAARGGTPGIELISPPPHHDTYSIEDLAQLIHDAKAARVRVIVKLVSSEGIGTIAVGVAKAGADVINVAGNTGGTGAAAVTSLKYAGRSAEIGVAEVHQALVANGLRQKVVLRCSGAHQTGGDVITSALLGGDSFEFGTTALMMLGCVMAKNCNVKCPAGLTTNPEVFEGDARALAQYLMNIAHDVRRILASLGLRSLREARGRSDLLQLLEHPSSVGTLDVRAMLELVPEKHVAEPVYLEKDFSVDDALLEQVRAALVERGETSVTITDVELRNRHKTVGGQLSIDIERMLNHELEDSVSAGMPSVRSDDRGRRHLVPESVRVRTHGSAGQSYGAFTGDGVDLRHTGTANDGVGKSQCGGRISVVSPGGGSNQPGGNVLIGNFALFGAMGGRTFVAGEAGDRFAVRNSGATAVVEGVGEFACEYMTNGAVLNLGTAGRGLGNGMSGGFFYQHDPMRTVRRSVSSDSVMVLPLTEHPYHEQAAKQLLQWHLEATGSALAVRLLADWERTREDLFVGMPLALLRYQDVDQILAGTSRKELVEEFASAIAHERLRQFKLDYRDHTMVIGGRAPAMGENGSADMFALLASYTILSIAQEMAMEKVPDALGKDDPRVQEATKNLVLTEDFFVMQRVTKLLRRALDDVESEELAALIAAKRLRDYETSLELRNVRSMDVPGTYGWIAHQRAKSSAKIDPVHFDEAIASSALDDLVRQAPAAPQEVTGR